MLRGITVTTTLLIAALEPLNAPPEADLLRYSITQGGLFMVVLVLLWYIRSQHQSRVDSKDATLQVLVSLTADVKVALSQTADAVLTQARAIDQLTQLLNRIDERKSSRQA